MQSGDQSSRDPNTGMVASWEDLNHGRSFGERSLSSLHRGERSSSGKGLKLPRSRTVAGVHRTVGLSNLVSKRANRAKYPSLRTLNGATHAGQFQHPWSCRTRQVNRRAWQESGIGLSVPGSALSITPWTIAPLPSEWTTACQKRTPLRAEPRGRQASRPRGRARRLRSGTRRQRASEEREVV